MSLLDLSNVPTSASQRLLPNGTYTFMATKSILKKTKAGDGEFIEVTLECQNEAFKKRNVWARFNIKNKSAEATQIGLRQLKDFLKAAGKDPNVLHSADELVGYTVDAVIGSSHKPPYDPQNIVKKFGKAPDEIEAF